MATFDGAIKTRTRVPLDKDSFQPGMGSLVGSAFTEDAKILGKRNELVTGNITLKFMANEDIHLQGNQTEMIIGNRNLQIVGKESETVISGRTTMIVGQLTETYIAGQMTTCIGPYNRTDVAPVTWLCPTQTMINSGDLYECKIFDGAITAIAQQNTGIKIETTGQATAFTIHKMEATSFQTEVEMIHGMATITTNEANGLNNLLSGMINNASGTTARLRALDAGVGPEVSPPLELGAPPFS